MQKISLCMISLNEQANIERCLKSVTGVVDEIVIVDTGSKDGTVEIAQRYGAKVIQSIWTNDFSQARNESLKYATGNWILILDADEELASSSRNVLRRCVNEDSGSEGYFIKIVNFLGNDNWAEPCADLVFRLFKNKSGYEFHGAIHEQIVDVILQVNPDAKFQVAEDVIVNHYGYLNAEIDAKNKKIRNISIIEEEIVKQPNDRMLRYHYGVELYRAGRYEEAAEQLAVAADGIDVHALHLPKLLRYIVLSYYAAKNYNRALYTIDTAIKLFPNYADIYFYAGLVHYEQQNYGLAYAFFNKALDTGEQPAFYASFSGLKGFRAYYFLGQIAEQFCNEEEAMRYYILSISDQSAFFPALEKICALLKPWRDVAEAKQALDTVFDFSDSQAYMAVAGILFKQNAYELALHYLEEYQKRNCLTDEQQLWKMICLIQQKRLFEALKLMEHFPRGNPYYPLCQLNKMICFWLQGSIHKVLEIAGTLMALGLSNDTAAVIDLVINAAKPVQKKCINLGTDGFMLMHDVLIRLLGMKEIDKVTAMLNLLDSETTAKFSKVIGETLLKYESYDLAEYYFSLAVGDPFAADIDMKLAEVFEKKEMYSEAEYYYRQAIAKNPKDPQNYIKLLNLYEQMRLHILHQAVEKHPDVEAFSSLLKEAETKLWRG